MALEVKENPYHTSRWDRRMLKAIRAEIEELGLKIMPPPVLDRCVVTAFGIQKGGNAKTTSAAIFGKLIAYALSQVADLESQVVRGKLTPPDDGYLRSVWDAAVAGHRKVTRARGSDEITGVSRRRVLIVDLDPQGNQADMFGVKPLDGYTLTNVLRGERSVTECLIKLNNHLFLLPSDDTWASYEQIVAIEERKRMRRVLSEVRTELLQDSIAPERRAELLALITEAMQDLTLWGMLELKKVIDSQRELFDRILIDLPPSRGFTALAGLLASDEVIVTAEASELGRLAIPRFMQTLDEAMRLKRKAIEEVERAGGQWIGSRRLDIIGILITRYQSVRDQRIRAAITNEYGDLVFENAILDCTRIARAAEENVRVGNKDIFDTYGEALHEWWEREAALMERLATSEGV